MGTTVKRVLPLEDIHSSVLPLPETKNTPLSETFGKNADDFLNAMNPYEFGKKTGIAVSFSGLPPFRSMRISPFAVPA